jgi:hypothetical protein
VLDAEQETFLAVAARPNLTRFRSRNVSSAAMESLQRAELAGFDVVIAELEVELDYLRRSTRHLGE